MASPAYADQLRDPRWQATRKAILRRDGFRCRVCPEKKGQMDVHHSYYIPGNAPWEYPDVSLITVCHACHEGIHAMLRKRRLSKRKMSKTRPQKSESAQAQRQRAKSYLTQLREALGK